MLTFFVCCCALLFLLYGWAYLDTGIHLLARDEYQLKGVFAALLGVALMVSSFGLLYLRAYLAFRFPEIFWKHPVARVKLLERDVFYLKEAVNELKSKGESK